MKRNLTNLALRAALASSLAGISLTSYAVTQTANLDVTATIAANCTISTTAVAFGAYDPIVANAGATAKDATGTVVTTCTTGSAPTITLAEGANAATGSTAAIPIRQMASGVNRLGYALYSDAARTVVWSNTGVATPTASGTAQSNTVYGRVSGGQNKPTGSYADVVVATVTF